MCLQFFTTAVIIAILGASYAVAYGTPGTPPSDPNTAKGSDDSEASLVSLEASIRKMIANPRCETDSDCKAIAFGAKACGGPKSYLYYSTRTVDEALLQARVAEYFDLDQKRNSAQRVFSTCNMVEPQVPQCVGPKGKKACQPSPRS